MKSNVLYVIFVLISALLRADDLGDLNEAIRKESYEQIKTVIKSLKDIKKIINEQDEHGNTPLHIAAQRENIDIIKLLILNGADSFKIQNKQEETPLKLYNNEQFKKPELKTGKWTSEKVFSPSEYLNGSGPLHWAILEGNNIEAKNIIHNSKDYINSQTIDGRTPLYYAVLDKNYDIVKELLKNGADVHKKYRNDNTILHIAAKKPVASIIQLLIAYGAKLNAKNDKDATALDMVQERVERDSNGIEIISLLAPYNPSTHIVNLEHELRIYAA